MDSERRNRLLIVEDSVDLQDLIKELFESEGYEVNCVSNGQEALTFLRGHTTIKPDLILLDLMMPVMDGFEFRREQLLDQRISGIPVVILTADANINVKAEKLSAIGSYNKAGGVDALLSVVKEHIGSPHGV